MRIGPVFCGHELRQPVTNLACRILRRLAVQIGAGRGGGGRRVGDLAGVGGAGADVVEADAEFVRDDLHDLGVDALAHFGAAMIDQNRAIDVDVHQRAGLIQMGQVEGDTELDRCERKPFFEYRTAAVKRVDVMAALAIVAAGFEFCDQFVQYVVFNFLAVRGDVAAFRLIASV